MPKPLVCDVCDVCGAPATVEYQTCEVRFRIYDGKYDKHHDLLTGDDTQRYCDDHDY
jgi:hypothetical protein